MEIGQKIRELRSKKGISQLALAKKAGISNTYLSDIEIGRTIPSIKTLLKLARILDVDASVFLQQKNQNKKGD